MQPADPHAPSLGGGALDHACLEGVLRAATRVSIIATDAQGIIRIFNSGAERMLGYAASEMVGLRTPAAIHLPEEVEAYGRELTLRLGRPVEGFEAFVAMARQGGAEAYDARRWTYVRKDGGHIPVDLVVTAIRAEASAGQPGEIQGFLGIAVDMTEREKLQTRLNRALISVDSAADMIFWCGAEDRRIDFVNEAALATLGYGREELLGQDVALVNPDRDEASWRQLVEDLRHNARAVREARFRHKNGARLPVEITAALVTHKGREFVVGIVRDIAARKALEAELTRAQASVDSASDMIFWTSLADRRFHFVNRAACEALGYTREELVGMRVEQLNPARDEDSWRKAKGLLHTQGRFLFQAAYRRKDGTFLPVETTVSLVEHEGQQYAVGIARDISERKALEADLLRAQTSVDSASDMIFWTGTLDRRIDFVNEACCRALGYTRQEMLGMDVALVNPGRAPLGWSRLVERLRTQGRATYEASFRRKDGSELPVEISASLARHENREYVQAIVRDITERRRIQARADRQLRVSNALAEVARALVDPGATPASAAALLLARARELTGSAHGMVAAVAQPGGHLDILAATDMMPGHPLPEGRHLFTPVDKDRYPGLWGHSLTTRKGFYENNPAGHPSARGVPQGHIPVARLLAVPVLIPASGGPRAIGQIALANPGADYTAEDLAAVQSLADLYALGAEQLRIRAELVSARDEAQAASRAKSEFLANMTHEVRTPLNGILGMLQVLQSTGLSEEQADCADVALQSASKLATQLNNVLEFARLDAAGEAECTLFPPTDLLHSLEAQFAPAARAKGLAFGVEAEPGLPDLAQSDPAALRQALAHLIDNAIKFTEAGEVRLRALPCPHQPDAPALMAFRVEDTGIGIPEHLRQSVFGPFIQADATTTRKYGGTGLGLAIAGKLAARLGGGISVQPRPGGGTVMILTARVDCTPRTDA